MNHLTPGNWIAVLILSIALAVMTTMYFMKPVKPTGELDIAVVNATHAVAFKYCQSINSKNFIARSSGLEAQAGCGRLKK